jgi:hypothetical protein
MDRREFLRITATTAAGGAVFARSGGLLDPGIAVAATGTSTARYRGTSDGKIYVSYDSGRTWTLHTKFGSNVAVEKVGYDARKRVVATLTIQGYAFDLALRSDGRTWRTMR